MDTIDRNLIILNYKISENNRLYQINIGACFA